MSVGGYSMERVASSAEMPKCPNECGAYLEITFDAIGRARTRCPRCNGVNRHQTHHPDGAPTLQELITIPVRGPHQLYCQGCAEVVPESRRFCVKCRPPRAKRQTSSSTSSPTRRAAIGAAVRARWAQGMHFRPKQCR